MITKFPSTRRAATCSKKAGKGLTGSRKKVRFNFIRKVQVAICPTARGTILGFTHSKKATK
jgi:hypothetical protein